MQIYNDGAQGTPAGSSGGGGRVELDDTSTLTGAGDKVQGLRSYSDKAQTRLEGATGASAAFGSYPAGQSFAEHHDAVAKVMATTMGGMSADIETFGGNIVTSAKNYVDTDETIAGSVQALGINLRAPSKVDDAFKAASDDQGNKLTNVQMDAGDAETAGTLDETTEMLGGTDSGEGNSANTHETPDTPAGPGPKTS